ncbi:hypothetical protein F1880_002901 [Penicillium rolfsii]|nr:hypothetical protein F1880_002901 [Penicillium rolfsii]
MQRTDPVSNVLDPGRNNTTALSGRKHPVSRPFTQGLRKRVLTFPPASTIYDRQKGSQFTNQPAHHLTRQFSRLKPKTVPTSEPTNAVAGISGTASPAPAPELMSTGLPGWPWLGSSACALIVPTTPSRGPGPESGKWQSWQSKPVSRTATEPGSGGRSLGCGDSAEVARQVGLDFHLDGLDGCRRGRRNLLVAVSRSGSRRHAMLPIISFTATAHGKARINAVRQHDRSSTLAVVAF